MQNGLMFSNDFLSISYVPDTGLQAGLHLLRVNYTGIGGEQVSEVGGAGWFGGQVGARSRSDPELVNSGAEPWSLWMSWGAWPWGPHT